MSKPEDVSQEAWERALAAFGSPNVAVEAEDIARAIMAAEKRGEERERAACASAAFSENRTYGFSGIEALKAYMQGRADAAAAIRARSA